MLDLLYSKSGHGTIAVEVKVDEDWEHPICEPLGDLLEHNAVINIRVPFGQDKLDAGTRSLVSEAEHMLEASGRAGFIYVWSQDTSVLSAAQMPTNPDSAAQPGVVRS